MKNILKFSFLIICFSFLLFGCDKPCDHNYEKKVINPTCTTDGYTINICSLCEDSYNSDVIRANGHNSVTTKTGYPATCTESGLTDETVCTICETIITEQEKISIKGHNYSAWVEITKPTIETSGKLRRVCGNDKNHIEECTLSVLNKDSEDYGYNLVESTCTKEGLETYTFIIDSQEFIYTIIVEKIPHDYEINVTLPTCTKEGYTTHECYCGDTYTSDVTEKIPHDYEINVTLPTCTKEGYTTHECYCGDTYTSDVTEKIPHDYENNVTLPTCKEEGYTTYKCYCGDTYIGDYVNSLGHKFSSWTATIIPTITSSGSVEQVCLNGCNGKNIKEVPALSDSSYEITSTLPTCTIDGVDVYSCLIDNQEFNFEVIVPKTGHLYEAQITLPTCLNDGYTTYTCHCNDTYYGNYVSKLGHEEKVSEKAVDATCLGEGKSPKIICSRCEIVLNEAVNIPSLGHVDKNYNYECDRCEIPYSENIVYISTYEDLVKINEDLNGIYQLVCDITITNDSWNGLGNSTNPFTGYLYGAGYTISGLNSTSLVYNNCGVINNITLKGASISCATNSDVTMGLLTTLNSGVIKNCVLKGANRITAACSYVIKDAKKSTDYSQSKTYITGGFTAINDGDILNCNVEDSFTTIFNNYTEHDFYIAPIFGGFYAGEKATSSMTAYFGIIAGKNNKNIENCMIYAKNVNTFNVSGALTSNSGYARTYLTAYVATICGANTGTINNVKVYQEPTMSQSIAANSLGGSNNFDCGILNSFNLVTNNDFKNLISSNTGQVKEVLLIA